MGQGRLPGLKLGLPVPQHLPEGLPKLLPLTSWGGLLNLLPLLAVTSATKAPCGPCVSRGFTTWSFKMRNVHSPQNQISVAMNLISPF